MYILYFPVLSESSYRKHIGTNHGYHALVVKTIVGLVEHENEFRAGLLYDAERRVVVWEKNMHLTYPIASLTKMMVALLTAEDVRSGKVDWNDKVTVERLYKKRRRSRTVHRRTESYTLKALVQLAMIPSNNTACRDIAEYLNGSLKTFVERMNDKARSLGMMHTVYFNASGLPGRTQDMDNRSSPYDLLLLALELVKLEEIMEMTSVDLIEINNDKRKNIFRNHNHLVADYGKDVDGLKTGYTRRAKYCLVATAKKESHRLIGVVLGVDSSSRRNEIVVSMLTNYYCQIGLGPMSFTGQTTSVTHRPISYKCLSKKSSMQ
jgi:D-alanyl-D-alanine carboxypeptidase (penicillin-binding protein 5/6)